MRHLVRSTIVFHTGSISPANTTRFTQQTRDIDPMLDQYWSTGYDAGPTSVQHWVDVSCLLGVPAYRL